QPPEAEPVPESAKKNEPRSVREVACTVTQPQRTRIALHMRPGRNMRACAPSGCLRVRGILLGRSPHILRLQAVFRILNSAHSCRIRVDCCTAGRTVSATRLPPDSLRRPADTAALDFTTTAELEPLPRLPGQERPFEALAFGLDVDSAGFNIFVVGAE